MKLITRPLGAIFKLRLARATYIDSLVFSLCYSLYRSLANLQIASVVSLSLTHTQRSTHRSTPLTDVNGKSKGGLVRVDLVISGAAHPN